MTTTIWPSWTGHPVPPRILVADLTLKKVSVESFKRPLKELSDALFKNTVTLKNREKNPF